MHKFSNTTVLITGASAGFGAATAQLFAQEGARLILTARRGEKLKKLTEELKDSYGTECLPLVFDVRDEERVRMELNALPDSFSTPDILINNAGLSRGLSKMWEVSSEEWNEMIDTNVKGLLNVTRHLLPRMLKADRGHIINVGSVSGHETYPGGGVYCASKFAVRALTDTLRMELVDSPIRVSMISPGMAKTEFSLVRFWGDEKRAEKVYEGLEPLKAEDIAEAILFIASRPPHVNIADIVMYPKSQASTTLIHRAK